MPEFISVLQATQDKGGTAQALRKAIQHGKLNAIKPAPRSILILRDDAYSVQSTCGQTHIWYKTIPHRAKLDERLDILPLP